MNSFYNDKWPSKGNNDTHMAYLFFANRIFLFDAEVSPEAHEHITWTQAILCLMHSRRHFPDCSLFWTTAIVSHVSYLTWHVLFFSMFTKHDCVILQSRNNMFKSHTELLDVCMKKCKMSRNLMQSAFHCSVSTGIWSLYTYRQKCFFSAR